jgi:hypothetical protein
MVNFINNQVPANDANLNKAQTDLQNDLIASEEQTTNYFINGKQVYVKRIDFGALPNASTKKIATGLNVNEVTICRPLEGFAHSTSQGIHYVLTLPDISPNYAEGATRLSMDSSNSIYNVVITTGIDRSSYTGYVDIYYTKNNE